ncbi:MAG: SxtJ family membrane protein [Candidatus Wallbacteria bacterium]|nr:SxtJ family membrane protein [Candidatus Wallbacteria bacterium]
MNMIPKKITKDQCRDSGMALCLILMILGHTWDGRCFSAAAVILLLDMICPAVFKPFAFAWLTLSNVLGTVMSKLVLGLVFFLVVTPIGALRRLLGEDLMSLKGFKKNSQGSVFVSRDHLYTEKDLEKPF